MSIVIWNLTYLPLAIVACIYTVVANHCYMLSHIHYRCTRNIFGLIYLHAFPKGVPKPQFTSTQSLQNLWLMHKGRYFRKIIQILVNIMKVCWFDDLLTLFLSQQPENCDLQVTLTAESPSLCVLLEAFT